MLEELNVLDSSNVKKTRLETAVEDASSVIETWYQMLTVQSVLPRSRVVDAAQDNSSQMENVIAQLEAF